MDFRSNIKMLNYIRKFLLNDTDNILPFPVRPQKPLRTGKLPHAMPRVSPQEAGIPPAALDTFLRTLSDPSCATHACIILHRGRVVCEGYFAPYSAQYWHITHSLCKSVTGTAIGMLIDEGRLSLDEHICDIFPEKCGLLTSRKMRTVTVRHLLTMTSGVSFRETGAVCESDWVRAFLDSDFQSDPGKEFDYNSMNSYMLSAIVRARTGAGLCTYLRPRLFEPLGFGDIAWETCPMGIEKGGWGLYLYLEDAAKLGLLYAQNGIWRDENGRERRILSEEWIRSATAVQATASDGSEYGYQLWPQTKDKMFMFNGMFGQYVAVIPEQELVIAINAGSDHMFTGSPANLAMQKFLAELADSSALPCNDSAAEERLAFTLRHLTYGTPVPEMSAPPAPQPWYIRLLRRFFPPEAAPAAPLIPDAVRPLLDQHWQMDANRAGMMPLISSCMEDWYTRGVARVFFEADGEQLTLFWTENDVEYKIPIGLEKPENCELEFGGNRYVLGTMGKFTTDEDDIPVLKLTVCFLESSCSRLLKFVFEPDGSLILKLSEAPGVAAAMRSLQNSTSTLAQGFDSFKDMNYLQYLIRRLFAPVIFGRAEPSESNADALTE